MTGDISGNVGRLRTGISVSADTIAFKDVSDKNRLKKITLGDAVRTATSAPVAGGSSLTLTAATHGGKIINLDTAAGTTITLPPATGSGIVYKFIVSLLATSNSHIVKVANASDTMQGYAFFRDDTSDNATSFFAVAGTSDTITLNRSTTGSVVIGETITVTDVATNRFQVECFLANTAATATPFSATV